MVPKSVLQPGYLAFSSLAVALTYGVPYLDNEFNLQKGHPSSPRLSPVHYKEFSAWAPQRLSPVHLLPQLLGAASLRK